MLRNKRSDSGRRYRLWTVSAIYRALATVGFKQREQVVTILRRKDGVRKPSGVVRAALLLALMLATASVVRAQIKVQVQSAAHTSPNSTSAAPAPAPTAPAQPQPLTLWGVTIGAPVPTATIPKCPEFGAKNMLRGDPLPKPFPCLRVSTFFTSLENVPYEHTLMTLELGTDKHVESMLLLEVADEECEPVRVALEGKLGKPEHTTAEMANGFGAHWQGDAWVWNTPDGSRVNYAQHTRDRDHCNLVVESAAAQERSKPTAVAAP